jgi:hypothetical protein
LAFAKEFCHDECSGGFFYTEQLGFWVNCNPAASQAVVSPEGVCPPIQLPNGRQ